MLALTVLFGLPGLTAGQHRTAFDYASSVWSPDSRQGITGSK
jgi:hypothetical protein